MWNYKMNRNKSAYVIGIDVGSTTTKGVVLSVDKRVLYEGYRRHNAKLNDSVVQFLRSLPPSYSLEFCKGIAFTGSGAQRIADLLGCQFVNEIVARMISNCTLYPQIKTIIEIGGEDSRFISLGFDEVLKTHAVKDFAMNKICAAGTGAFLDQYANRLGLSVSDFGDLALQSKTPSRVAGRCSVFAESDMVHLQQVGTPLKDIVAGLCYALARNFSSDLAKDKQFECPIAFEGGVAANKGVVKAFEDILELDEGTLLVPRHYKTLGAIGAAIALLDNERPPVLFPNVEVLAKKLVASYDQPQYLSPLKAQVPEFLEGENEFEHSDLQGGENVYMGIDVGSVSTKIVVMTGARSLLLKKYFFTSGDPLGVLLKGLQEVKSELADVYTINGVGITGSARHYIAKVVGADSVNNEITAQAKAALSFCGDVDTVFEIGGQDSKYIRIKDGCVVDFEMNKACSAGTGSFLDEQAKKLQLDISGEFERSALQALRPISLGERCTVFMQSNLKHYQTKGASSDDLAAGLCYSVVKNYLQTVVANKPVGDRIVFQGGVAFNKGICAAFESVLQKKMTIPAHHEVSGAIGVALIVMEDTIAATRFKGFDLEYSSISAKSFICPDCPNECEVHMVVVGETEYSVGGSRCEKYDQVTQPTRGIDLPDLFEERGALLQKTTTASSLSDTNTKLTTVGIPRSMDVYFDMFPFWNTFFRELGFQVVVSDETNEKIIRDGVQRSVAEFCYPIKVLYGHVQNLIDKKVDHIFLPAIINAIPSDVVGEGKNDSCPYVQAIPYIVKAGMNPKESDALVMPLLQFGAGKRVVASALCKEFQKCGLAYSSVKQALNHAYEQYERFIATREERGLSFLERVCPDRIVIVLVGHSYNTCDRVISVDLSKKLKRLGIAVIPLDYLPLRTIDISEEWPDLYWSTSKRILKAAQFIGNRENVYPIYFTNFGCAVDAVVGSFFKKVMMKAGKAFLEIEADEHSGDAGIVTRIEAFIDSLAVRKTAVLPEAGVERIREVKAKPDSGDIFLISENGGHIGAASLRLLGYKAECLPPADQEALQIGRKICTNRECLPLVMITGSFFRELYTCKEQEDAVLPSYYCGAHNGPCQWGHFPTLYRMFMEENAYDSVSLYAHNRKDASLQQLHMNKKDKKLFRKTRLRTLICKTTLAKVRNRMRAYEVHEGDALRVYVKYMKLINNELSMRKVCGLIESAGAEFRAIPTTRFSQKPVVLLCGESYIRSSTFANNGIKSKLEKMGIELYESDLQEYWEAHLKYRRQLSLSQGKYLRYFAVLFQLISWRMAERVVRKKLKDTFADLLLSPYDNFFNQFNDRYFSTFIRIRSNATVNKIVGLLQKGFPLAGCVYLKPLNCMAGNISEAILRRVQSDYNGFPILTLVFDGLEDTNMQTRIEAFAYQVRHFQKSSEFKKSV